MNKFWPNCFTVDHPDLIRANANNPDLVSEELFVGKLSGHLFKPGDLCILIGLQDYPEYNGSQVIITNIREDGPHGKAYYIQGKINALINWVYEYRLKRVGLSNEQLN